MSELFSQNPNPQALIPMLATLGMHSQRLMRLNESRHIEHVLFHMQPPAR